PLLAEQQRQPEAERKLQKDRPEGEDSRIPDRGVEVRVGQQEAEVVPTDIDRALRTARRVKGEDQALDDRIEPEDGEKEEERRDEQVRRRLVLKPKPRLAPLALSALGSRLSAGKGLLWPRAESREPRAAFPCGQYGFLRINCRT